ncbi:MAG: hypothetical protein JO366_17760 [Methylobacteriaceae bacterium]|nr:hypothetical protein [Methylobacteriaceae bacterium]MBV9220259.1 hypothetical protein [Methylobacteriaceae bacterium]MBV9246646.1 hypothetical protein [Methylobacteriaceae bacterium]MBV9637585.1 hypothetical protein [Methylobacteriaceae bacterium]MBV9702228.1 hypothetical protein [Methylobacteriaceae bacterium]
MNFRLDPSLVVPWLLTLVTVGVGIWQFSQQQQEAHRQPFLQQQLDLCFQASDAAARLATETDPAEWEKARKTFWRLYWGTLSIVEDRGVEEAMVEFGKLVPDAPVAAPTLPMKSLAQPSFQLAHAARDLILASWRVDLSPLERLPQ